MAKKRYYQDKKDRMDESRAMKRFWASKEDVGSHYDPRRRAEYEDSMMIKEDKMAPANLPQNVVHKYYNKGDYGVNSRLDDTIRGVDDQLYDDYAETKRQMKPEKY